MVRSTNTEADVELQFQPTTIPQEVPQAETIQSTLVTGLSNPNITSNLSVVPGSITLPSMYPLCRTFHSITSLQFGITAITGNTDMKL